MRNSWLVFILLFSMFTVAKAQGPQFSQFYAAPSYLNPALTGNTEMYRLSAIYRNQWNAVSRGFVSYGAAIDRNYEDFNSGVGLTFLRDQAGTGQLSFTSFSIMYRYRVVLSEGLFLNLGAGFGTVRRGANTADLTFSDQINTGSRISSENFDFNRRNYGDISFGSLIYGQNFWGGIAAYHLNRPNESLLKDVESRVPTQWSLHGGYRIPMEETKKGEVLKSMTFAANYKFQKKFDQLDLGMYYTHNALIFGVWYRGLPLKRYEPGYGNHDAIVPMLGMLIDDFRMAYSYDITASQLSGNTAGSHEISIQYEFPSNIRKKKKSKKRFVAPCPRF